MAACGGFEELLTYVVFAGWIFYALGAASIFYYRRLGTLHHARLSNAGLSLDTARVRARCRRSRVEHSHPGAEQSIGGHGPDPARCAGVLVLAQEARCHPTKKI